jgi:hypothetical protein
LQVNQVAPEFVEMLTIGQPPKTGDPADTAASLVPSADEATQVQLALAALVSIQVAPESVEA